MHLANALHNDLIALHVVRLLILESTSPSTRSGKRCWTAIMHRQSTDHRGISALVTLIKERVIFQTQIVIILFIFSPSRYRESLYTNNVSYLLNQLLWNSSLQDSKLYEKSAASVLKNILEPIFSSWLTSTQQFRQTRECSCISRCCIWTAPQLTSPPSRFGHRLQRNTESDVRRRGVRHTSRELAVQIAIWEEDRSCKRFPCAAATVENTLWAFETFRNSLIVTFIHASWDVIEITSFLTGRHTMGLQLNKSY